MIVVHGLYHYRFPYNCWQSWNISYLWERQIYNNYTLNEVEEIFLRQILVDDQHSHGSRKETEMCLQQEKSYTSYLIDYSCLLAMWNWQHCYHDVDALSGYFVLQGKHPALHATYHTFFTCRISSHGRCHDLPCLNEFSEVVPSCFARSRQTSWTEVLLSWTGRLAQTTARGSCLFKVMGQE